MKSGKFPLRTACFDVEEKARRVRDLECTVREFEAMAVDLDAQVRLEEKKTGIQDPELAAYSFFAKSAAQRRDNLRASVSDLRVKLDLAYLDHNEAINRMTEKSRTSPTLQKLGGTHDQRLGRRARQSALVAVARLAQT